MAAATWLETGPRPPLPAEVTAYNGTVYRRLYIKPGITQALADRRKAATTPREDALPDGWAFTHG